MRRLKIIGPFFVTLVILTGCTSKRNPPPEPPKEHFRLDSKTTSELHRVGCRATDTDLNCSEIEDLHGIQDMSWTKRNLEQKKRALEKRIQAIDALGAELDLAVKNQWSSETQKTLDMYSSKTAPLRAQTVETLESVIGEIAKEDLFQTNLGYRCSGTYGIDQLQNSFDQSFLFQNGLSLDTVDRVSVAPKEQTDGPVKVRYETKGKNFRLRIGNENALPEKAVDVNLMSVWIDGEFSLDWTGGPYLASATCMRITGLEKNPTQMTQRIVERARLKCETYSIIPASPAAQRKVARSGTIEANYGRDEKSTFIFATSLKPEPPFTSPFANGGFKYLFDLSSESGELTFTLSSLETNQILATVKTRNSSDQINLSYYHKGFGALIACEVPK